MKMKDIVLIASGLATLGLHAEPQTNLVIDTEVPDQRRAEDYPYLLPIFGADAYEKGYDLPLPVGIGLSHMYAERDITVTSIRAGINNPGNSVDDLLDVEVESEVSTTVARLDAWLFPFMNVYGFYGHVDNKSPVVFNAEIPQLGGGSTNVTVNSRFDLSGPTYGGGVVLAGGYEDYFMTLDANFFKADLTGSVSEEFSGATYSARAGWNGEVYERPTRFWLGASYWKTESVVSGSIPTGILNNTIEFEVDQEPANPLVYTVGSYIELTRKIHLTLDFGTNFDDAITMLAELNYRFF